MKACFAARSSSAHVLLIIYIDKSARGPRMKMLSPRPGEAE